MDNKIKKEDLGDTSGGMKIYYSISTGNIGKDDKCVLEEYIWGRERKDKNQYKHYVVYKKGDNSRKALDMIEYNGEEEELLKELRGTYNIKTNNEQDGEVVASSII